MEPLKFTYPWMNNTNYYALHAACVETENEKKNC